MLLMAEPSGNNQLDGVHHVKTLEASKYVQNTSQTTINSRISCHQFIRISLLLLVGPRHKTGSPHHSELVNLEPWINAIDYKRWCAEYNINH